MFRDTLRNGAPPNPELRTPNSQPKQLPLNPLFGAFQRFFPATAKLIAPACVHTRLKGAIQGPLRGDLVNGLVKAYCQSGQVSRTHSRGFGVFSAEHRNA